MEVTFDPAQVSYAQLLEVFWAVHDPTQRDRQGPDVGTQYRSAIYTHDEAQAAAARASKDNAQASDQHRGEIVTEIEPAGAFHMAEDYHQQYFDKQRGGLFGFSRGR